MPVLRERLIDSYATFYQRVAPFTDPKQTPQWMLDEMDLTYGPLVASLPEGSRVLDVGCGTGIILHWLSKQRGIIPMGVDRSASQIEIARKCIPHISVECADGLEYMRSHKDSFSAILCTDVLEHIAGDDLSLEWITALLEALVPGGFLFCRVPNAANFTGTYTRYMDLTHVRSFTSTSLLQFLEAGGFRGCSIVPTRSARLSGRARLMVEHYLHRAVFLICGKGSERVFTKDICAIGFND